MGEMIRDEGGRFVDDDLALAKSVIELATITRELVLRTMGGGEGVALLTKLDEIERDARQINRQKGNQHG